MKKFYLNDRANMTRKFLDRKVSLVWDNVVEPTGKEWVKGHGRYFEFSDGERVHAKYAVGDAVAVAMSYRDAGMDEHVFGGTAGWMNKTRVNAVYMPFRFVVEQVRCVRIQDLGEEEVLRAGVEKNRGGNYLVGGSVGGFSDDWREMFARLFDSRSKVPYALNPWVVVYDVTPVIGSEYARRSKSDVVLL